MIPASALLLNQRPSPPISNDRLGMMLLVGTETVLFSCFISAYMVLRMAAGLWPPAGTPPLQIGLSAINTAVLLLSALAAFAGGRSLPGKRPTAILSLGTALGLGILFLSLQGVEFYQLYARGLTLKTGPYGAVFYTLIGCHGLHVFGGLLFLGSALRQLASEHPVRGWASSFEMYWYFVTAVWLILFGILYVF